MKVVAEIENSFLRDLLDLQQDGRYAISAPTNWTEQPLLEVPTEIDAILNNILGALLKGNEDNDTARWHFFIGSPGNGKSAAMRKLCEYLKEKGCEITDENNVPIAKLDARVIPYALIVREKSKRGKKFVSVLIVQDASVVRNPFSSNVDPAKELLDTLEYAWNHQISLVVCTNRGILEKTHRDNLSRVDVRDTPWFQILKVIIKGKTSLYEEIENIRSFDKEKPVFKRVKIGYSYLDNRSLLLWNDTFERLILKAVNNEKWIDCPSCSANSLCPFKANRDWLTDDHARGRVLQILTRAEILSGQVIVFREALAIISLILAGCPRDYDGLSPCEWVLAKVESNDIFSLATRRIYMSIFTSYTPHGVEAIKILQERQMKAFHKFLEVFNEKNSRTYKAIKHITDLSAPSTDVGVKRLLGENGTIACLDPWREGLPVEFYNRWDSDFDAVLIEGNPCFTEIERTCLSIWKELEENLEFISDYSVSEAHWAFRRWTSNFLLHFGDLFEGRSAWAKELDSYALLLRMMVKENLSRNDKIKIKDLNEQLENLLNSSAGSSGNNIVKLSENVLLGGDWVARHLKPKVMSSGASGGISLLIEFPGREQVVFTPEMYLWLTRQTEGKLDILSLPPNLLMGIRDARVRAASKSNYAIAPDDVKLLINTDEGYQFTLMRIEGDVVVT